MAEIFAKVFTANLGVPTEGVLKPDTMVLNLDILTIWSTFWLTLTSPEFWVVIVFIFALYLASFVVGYVASWLFSYYLQRVIMNHQRFDKISQMKELSEQRNLIHHWHRVVHWSCFVLLSSLFLHGGALVSFLTMRMAIFFLILSFSSLFQAFADLSVYFVPEVLRKRLFLTSYLQLFKVLMWCIGGFFIFVFVFGVSFWALFSGVGAFMAVLAFVFREPLLNLVAILQISLNRILLLGDWVEFPQHNVEGEVVDITLSSVKILNFDNSMSILPPYSLMNEPFKNRGHIFEAQARRLVMDLNFDINSIEPVTQALWDSLESKLELPAYWKKRDFQKESPITNLTLYGEYLLALLRQDSDIRQDLTLLVRSIGSDKMGVCLQVYGFTSKVAFDAYERVKIRLFDHFLHSAPLFQLQLFQLMTHYKTKDT